MKKLVYILSCLFLLSAGFVACSNDTDDPPEQPNSHQNETPVDSIAVNNDSTEIDSTEVFTVISAVPASEEVKVFFDEALPYYCDSIIIGGGQQIGDFLLDHPEDLWTYNIIKDQESFESNYTGNKPLPHIDFNKYILIYGRYFLGLEEIIDSINIHITNNQSSIVLHTTRISTDFYDINERLKSFWAIFPKDMPEISGVYIDRRKALSIKPVEVNNAVKDFLDEALPNDKGVSTFHFSEKNNTEIHVINSRQEFEEAYEGESALPAIDFNKHTLIIGKAYMPGKYYHVRSMEIHDYNGNLMLYVQTDNPESLFWMAYNMYFWALFPKIEQEIASISIIPEN